MDELKHGLRNLLLNVLDEHNVDICYLCLKIIESNKNKISFKDEVVLSDNSRIEMCVVLTSVLGEPIISQLADIGSICNQCSVLAVDCYTFQQESKKNAEYITQTIEHLETLFGKTPQNLDDFKTFFLSLDLEPQLSSCHMFDNVDVHSNITNALARYKEIFDPNQDIKPKVGRKNQEYAMKTKLESPSKNQNTKNVGIKTDIKSEKLKHPQLQIAKTHSTKEFKCSKCPREYASAAAFQKHEKEAHTNLVCSECGKHFNHRYTLRMHEKAHFIKYICQDCGRVYKNQNTFRLHYNNNVCQLATRHSPATAKFTCDYCNKKYTQKMSLRVHIQYEHLNYKSHECNWCKKKFWCQSRLKAHIVKHTKERNFLCETCDRRFVTRESLLYHSRIHTGEKPYECPHCNSRFLSASRRKAHIDSQHQDPSVTCENCHSKFKSHHYLFKHLRSCLGYNNSDPNLLRNRHQSESPAKQQLSMENAEENVLDQDSIEVEIAPEQNVHIVENIGYNVRYIVTEEN